MRFLCDEMLKGLVRWLRAAGYDTTLQPDGTDDRFLVDRARAEGRILLTRDRRLMGRRGAGGGSVVMLECNDTADCLDELRRRLGIDWLHRPFSRCLNCNTPLVEADPVYWRDIPEISRRSASVLRYCPHCRQLFWDGSHVARMRARLERANAGPVGSASD